MVRFDEVSDIMNQMMDVQILGPCEKLKLLNNEDQAILDPNLIMEERHKIFRDTLPNSMAKCSALAEAKRLAKEEERKRISFQREREFLEVELRRFEMELCKTRPKFCGPCSRKNLTNSSDEDFWGTVIKVRPARAAHTDKPTNEVTAQVESTNENEVQENETTETSFANIKVTIKDKSNVPSQEERLRIMREAFEILKQNVIEERKYRAIKMKIQENAAARRMQRCLQTWKMFVKNSKELTKMKKESQSVCDDRKIENFIKEITEKQKELKRTTKLKPKENNLDTTNTVEVNSKKKRNTGKIVVLNSPAQSRLNAQKEIIEKQRSKLAEQNRIIEELKRMQIRKDLSEIDEDSLNTAKRALTYCGQQTRRSLVHLMRQAGYRDISVEMPKHLPNPPKFLARMEARAQERKERMKKIEEDSRKKLTEQKLKEEIAKKEEEERRKKLQQEALREAKRLREEEERQRLQEIERIRKLNDIANEFYCKLLRRYVIRSFKKLIEIRDTYMEKADHHYKKTLLLRNFEAWKMETERQFQIKLELATSVCNRNSLWYVFQNWRRIGKEEKQKNQVAKDFYSMKLQESCFYTWKSTTLEEKLKRLEDEKMAQEHYENKLKIEYFKRWKWYPTIAEAVIESERRKSKLREIVQSIIPDFQPKERGVALED